MGNMYGYIRVSTKEQNEDRQLLALKELPIPKKNLFVDKQSVVVNHFCNTCGSKILDFCLDN